MIKRITFIVFALLLPLFVFGQSAEECFQKGENYYYGKNGVTKDYAEAVKWYRKAAEKGDAHAQCCLGYCYDFGRGVTQDYAEAVKWYRKAAEQGHATAQNNLGNCYYRAWGVTQDYAEAVKWYRKAAEQGDADAQNNLGVCYDNGRGVAKDYAEAVKWFRLAAGQGDFRAQYNLGVCYDNGRGVTQDYAEAVKWYRKAAEQGHATAQNNLGNCYYNGRGVTKDYAEAVKWYRKAAEEGNDLAQYNLGLCYEKGNGVTQDYKTAKEWYQKALSKDPNYDKAKEGLSRITKILSEQSGGNSYAQNTTTQTQPQPKTQPKTTPQPKAGNNPVDTEIPLTGRNNKNTFAIIIANEDYQGESKVEYAKNDGEVFKSYCHKTLGLPEKNVHYVANATRNNIIGELYWLSQVCDAFKGDASVIFYYAGHGLPDEDSGSAYLLPVDGNSQLLPTCYSINELYQTLGKLSAKKVTVLMDACFSGAKRNGEMLASARGVAIKAKESTPQGNMIVLSAAQGNETAYKYEETKHGLFTYFLLKKLKETKGNVTMGELGSYLQDQVGRYSIVENGKRQTPSVQTSDKLKDNWESLRFD